MTIKTNKVELVSTLGIKHSRKSYFNYPDDWLNEKQKHDGAEGLWRIHDDLYDLTDFVDRHPGGKFWIEVTKGIDISEAFESHHIGLRPEQLLPKYYIRKAKIPRNSPYTFKENGFYKTLKRNVRKVWKDIPQDTAKKTDLMVDSMFAISVILGALSAMHANFVLAVISGLIVGITIVASHNYYHQKDNFRMYYNDMLFASSRDWRIVHVLSHHAYANSVLDLQAYTFEPFLLFYPHKKTDLRKLVAWISGPLFVWPTFIPALYISKYFRWKTFKENFSATEILPYILPTFLCIISNQPFWVNISVWVIMVTVASFWFCLVGLVTNHFNPDIFIDGDTARSRLQDWGVGQLDTVGEKYGIVNTHFLGLVSFGDHALHHLFPTVDHGVLQHLYPIFKETLEQFNLNLRVLDKQAQLVGYFEQLSKENPNPNPPDLSKYKNSF